MYELQTLKGQAEKLTGLGRPSRGELCEALRQRKPNAFRFIDDGLTPNNPKLPMVLYRSPIRLSGMFDPAAVFEELFSMNGWQDSWRNGIYPYLHYHSKIHEVLGIARGNARVQFGGPKGRKINLKAGDVTIMPAGTGHRLLGDSDDLLVVGAYPPFGKYDECLPVGCDHVASLRAIPKVPLPRKDPVYGRNGPLIHLWSKK